MLRLSGSARRRPHGKFPSVAVNDNGVVVEVHQPYITSSNIYAQVGGINGDEIDYSEERRVDSGRFPKVAINNDNRVIEVHEGKYRRKIHYNIGTINNHVHMRSTRVVWKPKPESVCPGRFPAVSMSGNRVVLTYDAAYGRYFTYYRIGTINAQDTINWGEERKLFDSGATETSIAMNQNDHVVASGRGWYKVIYRVGQVRNGVINWSNEVRYSVLGYCPTVCLNNDGDTIMVWQSYRFRQLSYAIGRVHAQQQEVFIEWNAPECRNYDYGYNPSVAISPNNNQVVEEHETNYTRMRCTLHYRTGELNRQAPDQPAAIDHEHRPGAQPQEPQIAARELNQQGNLPGNIPDPDAPDANNMELVVRNNQ